MKTSSQGTSLILQEESERENEFTFSLKGKGPEQSEKDPLQCIDGSMWVVRNKGVDGETQEMRTGFYSLQLAF